MFPLQIGKRSEPRRRYDLIVAYEPLILGVRPPGSITSTHRAVKSKPEVPPPTCSTPEQPLSRYRRSCDFTVMVSENGLHMNFTPGLSPEVLLPTRTLNNFLSKIPLFLTAERKIVEKIRTMIHYLKSEDSRLP